MTSIHCFVGFALTFALATACGSSDPNTGPSSSALGGSTSSGGGSMLPGNGGTSQTGTGGTHSGSGGNGPGSGGSSGETGGVAGANAGTGGANAGTGGSNAGSGGTEATDAGHAPVGPYPAGPYGNSVGATIMNLTLQGYVNATGDAISNTLPFVDKYSLDDVRKTGKPYLLIHVSEFYCPGCQHAAKQLGIDGKGILDAGGAALDILGSKLGSTPAKADLDAWITTANENVSAFLDGPGAAGAALAVATVRETVFIVQMPAMKIVWMVHGDVTGLTPPSIVAAAAQMHTLLGK